MTDIEQIRRKLHDAAVVAHPDAGLWNKLNSVIHDLLEVVEAQQKQIDTLISVFGTHRHGYRWEPTHKDGEPINDQAP